MPSPLPELSNELEALHTADRKIIDLEYNFLWDSAMAARTEDKQTRWSNKVQDRQQVVEQLIRKGHKAFHEMFEATHKVADGDLEHESMRRVEPMSFNGKWKPDHYLARLSKAREEPCHAEDRFMASVRTPWRKNTTAHGRQAQTVLPTCGMGPGQCATAAIDCTTRCHARTTTLRLLSEPRRSLSPLAA